MPKDLPPKYRPRPSLPAVLRYRAEFLPPHFIFEKDPKGQVILRRSEEKWTFTGAEAESLALRFAWELHDTAEVGEE